MPFNDNYEYEPSEQFEMDLKKCLSKYLYADINECTQKEYDKLFDLLLDIEGAFFQQYQVSNDDPNLTFEEKRDKNEEDMKQFAFPIILEKLYKLKKKRNKYNSNQNDQDWIKCETNVNEIVRKIWKIWCHERERRPRAGIIPIYYDQSSSVEILLTMYIKNNYIQYGFAKGKIEFEENIWSCAAREGAEELGLDAKIIYELIRHRPPIIKNVYYADIKTSIEHYYFIMPVPTKDIILKPNEEEIDGVKWHNAFTVLCCNNCQVKQSMQSIYRSTEPNYFMVNCSDRYKHNSLVLDILNYMDTINRNQTASQQYKTIHGLCCHN